MFLGSDLSVKKRVNGGPAFLFICRKLNMIKKQCMLSFVNNLYVIQMAGMKQGCCGRNPTHHYLANEQGSLRRLDRLYHRLNRMEITHEYNQVIEQQKEEGIVELACEPPVSKEFYLPHKPVIRAGAEWTKLRVVYDGSAKENPQSPSLNDCLYAGPSIQNKLWNVLTRMRFHPVALSGELRQAFLQIRIRKEERDSLRFHWKPTAHSQIHESTLRLPAHFFLRQSWTNT